MVIIKLLMHLHCRHHDNTFSLVKIFVTSVERLARVTLYTSSVSWMIFYWTKNSLLDNLSFFPLPLQFHRLLRSQSSLAWPKGLEPVHPWSSLDLDAGEGHTAQITMAKIKQRECWLWKRLEYTYGTLLTEGI